MKPGPKAHPGRRLADAAIEYAAALEAGDGTTAEWDCLRKAALAYRDEPRPLGRPTMQPALKPTNRRDRFRPVASANEVNADA